MTPIGFRGIGVRRPVLVAWLCLVGVLAVLLGCCASALAARGHIFSSTFAEPCTLEPCEGAHLKEPDGVAVNEATGDVFVVDKAANRLARFSKTGVFQSEVTGPNATGSGTLTEGSDTVTAVLTNTGTFTIGEEITGEGIPAGTTVTAVNPGGVSGVLELSSEVEAGKSGVAVELTARQRFQEPETIAVDNSCVLRKAAEPELAQGDCEAQDPSNGDVYVIDAGHVVVDKFSATGAYLGQIIPPTSNALQGVAVDPTGKVWIYRQKSGVTIDGYTNSTPNTSVSPEIVPNSIHGQAFPGFAVDSKGGFYGGLGALKVGFQQVAKWDHAGNNVIKELDNEFSSSVSVDETDDDSFLDNLTSVGMFSPEGDLVERLGQEGGAKHLTRGAGIGVNAVAGSLYVADAATGTIVVFGPAPAETPKVESESFSAVDSSSASLASRINSRSEASEAPSEYRFQYGRCASATSCASSGYEASAPVPDGQIPASFEVAGVGVKVDGLSASTTYHFRVLVRNSHGEGQPGVEMPFTTEGAGGELVLPDNRGWELVSPPDKRGARIEPITEAGVVQAASDGSGISYLANAPTEAQPEGYTNTVQILSRRGAASWSSRGLAIPHVGATGLAVGEGSEYRFFDSELQLSVVQPFGEFNPALSAEASEPTAFLRDLGEGCGSHCYRPLVTGKAGFANVPEGTEFGEQELCEPKAGKAAGIFCGPEFVGATEDLHHVVLNAHAALKSGAGIYGLYEWNEGSLSQVNLLPGGEAAPEGALGLEGRAARGAISSDGTRVAWERPKGITSIYLRDMPRRETVQLDAKETSCGPCGSGGGRFQIASADGSRVFFSDTTRLTSDSGASERKADLYECQIVLSGGKLSCELSDLTPESGGEGAAVQGGVLGASEDGSYLYFVAKGVLSTASNARGQSAIAGQPNLYVHHGASMSFIATLSSGDEHDWAEDPTNQPTRVSGNGQWLELMSQASLTGYDNRDVASGKPVAEVYLYDAASGRLSCASCEPSGVRPSGVEYIKLESGSGGLTGGREVWPGEALVAANVPGWTSISLGTSRYQPRYLNDEGRLFFNSGDALVPQDANGTQDVYEYEPPGIGSCSESSPGFSARSGGCVALISSGGSAQESGFLDASESGDDVFFLTSARLSPLDGDTARDVYDAHVCSSGSPCIVYPTVVSPPCTNEASCKPSPTPQPSIFGAPASATFAGPGNLTSAPLPLTKPKTVERTKAEKLTKALKACRVRRSKHKRAVCERAARKKYGARAAGKTNNGRRNG